jgi:hypothetical protein
MYAGGADEIAEHSQETADKINVMQVVLMRLMNTVRKQLIR